MSGALPRPDRRPQPAAALHRLTQLPWDAIIVGSGAGAGAFAWSLLRGRPHARLLVLEKGPELAGRRELAPDEVGSCRRDEFVPLVGDDPHVWAAAGRA